MYSLPLPLPIEDPVPAQASFAWLLLYSYDFTFLRLDHAITLARISYLRLLKSFLELVLGSEEAGRGQCTYSLMLYVSRRCGRGSRSGYGGFSVIPRPPCSWCLPSSSLNHGLTIKAGLMGTSGVVTD